MNMKTTTKTTITTKTTSGSGKEMDELSKAFEGVFNAFKTSVVENGEDTQTLEANGITITLKGKIIEIKGEPEDVKLNDATLLSSKD